MKYFPVLIVICCLALGAAPAMAKNDPPAKHEATKKSDKKNEKKQADTKKPAKKPEVDTGEKGDKVETPGRVIKEPNAFNGIKWGTGMAAIPDMSVVERDGPAAYATAEGVVYRIGDAFLSGVVYGFCQDRFAAVMVEYKGRKAHESIKKFLMEKYSKPIDLEDRGLDFGWPVGNVLIRMVFVPDKDVGTLSYFYQPLYAPCSGPKVAP